MGQYFIPVNLDRQEFLSSYDYGSGAKLTEHSWLLNPMLRAVVTALAPQGPWYRNRLVWAGDYMDEGLFMNRIKGKTKKEKTLYECCGESSDNGDTSCIRKVILTLPDGPVPKLIINHDSRQFVWLNNLPEEDPSVPGWHLHPLSLLTCSGNGRGGGDFRGNSPYVGTWAGHRISAGYSPPEWYTELVPAFTERENHSF